MIKALDIPPFWVYGIGTNTVVSKEGKTLLLTENNLWDIVTWAKKMLLEGGFIGGYFTERFDVPSFSTKHCVKKATKNRSHQVLDVGVANSQMKILIRPLDTVSGRALAWVHRNRVKTYSVVSGSFISSSNTVLPCSLDLIYNRLSRSIDIVDENQGSAELREFTVKVRIPQAYKQRFICLEYGIFGKDSEDVVHQLYAILRNSVRDEDGVFEYGKKVKLGEFRKIDV